MTRPLYTKEEAAQQPQCREQDGHAGLWFDKFCNKWSVHGDAWTMKSQGDQNNPKLDWIKGITTNPVGNNQYIEQHALRLMRLLRRRDGRAAVFTSTSRFVTGLGRSHPIENGFTWHPTLGTPYLPGSSIKGLVGSWAKESGAHAETIQRLLGDCKQAGTICFLDAVPTMPVQLEADVMTPHYAGWSKEEPPGDWCSPTPIPFLVMAEQMSLLFGIIPRGTVEDADLDTVVGWLREALAQAGSGAKTTVGYGRFDPDDDKTHQWQGRLNDEDRQRRKEQARVEAQKSPEARWRFELEEQSEADILELVRLHLEKDPLPDPVERLAFARAVMLLHPDWVKQWRHGRLHDQQTRVGKRKLKDRAKLLDNAIRELSASPMGGGSQSQ